jgi:hypothetical protein
MFKQTNDPHLDMLRNKFFKESFLGIAIFGVPAFSALLLGKYLDRFFGTQKVFTLVCLIVAFVSSWILIYFRNKRITKEYREYRAIQKQAPDLEEETNAESPVVSSTLENKAKHE